MLIPTDSTGVITLVSWLTGTAGTAYMMVYTVTRNARRDMEHRLDEMIKAREAGDKELWGEMNRERDRGGEFRERIASTMVTKNDLQIMKTDILTAIFNAHGRDTRIFDNLKGDLKG